MPAMPRLPLMTRCLLVCLLAASAGAADELHPGGAATGSAGPEALQATAPGLDLMLGLDAELGRALFEKLWVPAPTATRASDGLGPLFNARACINCHPGNGRGHLPEGGQGFGAVLKLSQPGAGAPIPHPVLGSQLQDRAATGLRPEGRMALRFERVSVRLEDGTEVALRRPVAEIIPAPSDPVTLALRVAPPLVGLGLIEAIPEAAIHAGADPEDRDGDGISGRAANVPSRALGQEALGRFGWKAEMATIADQSAQAFSHDLGLSTPLYPDPAGDCPTEACRAMPHGEDAGLRDGREVSGAALDLVALYLSSRAVPARRDPTAAEVLRGEQVFHEIGCAACHRPGFETGAEAARPDLAGQTIWPYSDFLLHDMGPGLADARPGVDAAPGEWRTPPLWGIGLTRAATGRESYLHDGRAETLLDAVLWHGGEARAARDRVTALPKADRAALIRFLESL